MHAHGGDGPARHRDGVVVGGVREGRPRLLPFGAAAGRRDLQDRWHLMRVRVRVKVRVRVRVGVGG